MVTTGSEATVSRGSDALRNFPLIDGYVPTVLMKHVIRTKVIS